MYDCVICVMPLIEGNFHLMSFSRVVNQSKLKLEHAVSPITSHSVCCAADRNTDSSLRVEVFEGCAAKLHCHQACIVMTTQRLCAESCTRTTDHFRPQ